MEPDGEFRGMLSGVDETTAGRVGVTGSEMELDGLRFWRSTMIVSVVGDEFAKKVEGIIARMSLGSRNREGTCAPFTITRLVEKKLLPLKYRSCCTEPSTAEIVVDKGVRIGSVAPATRTEELPSCLVSTTEVALIVRLPVWGVLGAV